MARPEVITVSKRELDRLKTVQAVVDGQLRPGVAAERLEITDRQFRRLLERYRQEGPSGLVSRKRGRPSNNRLSVDREAAARGLIREHYGDFGPTLAAEKLRLPLYVRHRFKNFGARGAECPGVSKNLRFLQPTELET
ncbi:helix-turn-helix domain-containing protein [Ralstonia pseudosolanacearum]|uniref:helix-turn-helix domain-containing protein n=1 Tax=Ralstonia pseudosolanacearum TaxID=1310165 RepID=UPI001FFBC8E1|nr:helix-turn-helix domain-containing protein [Ralstonia pseudosolanacearum]